MPEVRVIEIHENIFADNERTAQQVRKYCSDNKTFFLNVMSAPGSGKTTMLVELINRLKDTCSIFEMDVDICSTLDAKRVADLTGVPSLQIHNGGLCHIDADMMQRALQQVDLSGIDLLILENIGNLVCPAEFDTGAMKNIMLLSVPEGHDKPLKYPLMFQVADLIVVNKIDTMAYFDFDVNQFKKNLQTVNPNAEVISISAKTGEGMEKLVRWVENEIQKVKK
ncbi:MAG: hydrogenase nickel incorporation protein HypB [Erysipelotrichaceae bacterium]|nr:hydrogenase nickel incorporation protein HypB [Erysipelotrichaceae bacterium]